MHKESLAWAQTATPKGALTFPLPVISAPVEVGYASGRIKCASSPSIDVSPMLRPEKGAIFTSVDNGLD